MVMIVMYGNVNMISFIDIIYLKNKYLKYFKSV